MSFLESVFETATVRFVITSLPPGTPTEDGLWLRSNLTQWNARPDGWQFRQQGELWVLERKLPLGTLVEAKVTRGQPDSEEGDPFGHRALSHRVVVDGDRTVEIEVRGWQDRRAGQKPSTITGSLDRFTVFAEPLGMDREVMVWLPPSYHRGDRRYPVLYLHDGQNVFDETTSFQGAEWRADEAATELAARGLEVILVAVPVGGERNLLYTPFPNRFNGYRPRADEYITWLADHLRPHVNAAYRTLTSPEATGLAGSSFGGMISLYGGLTRTDAFGFVGALSPSLWLGDLSMFDFLRQHPAPGLGVYVDMGTHEGETVEACAQMVRLARDAAVLLHQGGADVRLQIADGHWHDEPAWAQRFPAALEWFARRVSAAHGRQA